MYELVTVSCLGDKGVVLVLDGLSATRDKVQLSDYELNPEVLRRVPRALALKHDVLALSADGIELTVALPDPNSADIIDRIRLATAMQVRGIKAPRETIRELLARAYPDFGLDRSVDINARKDEAPAIRMLNTVHDRAILASASDVHLEPTGAGGRVRQRIDGVLHAVLEVPADVFPALISRVKLLAGMDIADKRQPQDGRYTIETYGRPIDARVSSMPTVSGEKVVIRLLDHNLSIPSLENLGMEKRSLERYRRVVHAPHGFAIVCGPTGSGKTTTLYATLDERNEASQNLCSVEDPVEIHLSGISQVQVNPRAGMTFASAVRSFLRQDPNVVMIGEMRDLETAKVAISAALSGQLVLTTLHSSDTVRAIDRLLELGAVRHSIAAGLTAVVAQRLIRKLCVFCRIRAEAAYRASGCERCFGTGYRGRTGLFEFLFIDDNMREAIANGASGIQLKSMATEATFCPIIADGLAKLSAGITSHAELERVLGFDPGQ